MRSLACWLLVGVSLVPQSARGELSFQFNYIDDAANTFATRGWLDEQSLFQQNVRAAAAQWGSQFDSDETIIVRVDPESFSARAGGGFSVGRVVGQDPMGRDILEPGALSRVLTGQNPGDVLGYDIVLGFEAPFVEQFYWLDPDPLTRTLPVPSNQADFISVAMHELGHGFGMAGYRYFSGPSFGELDPATISIFDSLTYFGGDGNVADPNGDPNPMFFAGVQGAAVFGGDVPIANVPEGDPRAGGNF